MADFTDEEIQTLLAAQERGKRAMAESAANQRLAPLGQSLPAAALAAARRQSGPAEYVSRCEGGCMTPVARRHGWCPACAESAKEQERERLLLPARRSVSPDGALDWCRAGDPEYVNATKKGLAIAKGNMRRLFETAAWTREIGSVLVLGDTELGKSKLLTAMALRVIDLASRSEDREVVQFAAGIRRVSALDIARAREQSKFGDEPEVLRVAKRATLLILDEVGFEDMRTDPYAVRDLLRARYEPVRRPTFVASGMTFSDLEARYGAPTVRTLTSKGILVDLWPKAGGKT